MQEHYWSFVLFVLLMTGTPGPANLTLMAIGSSQGFRAGLPLITGAVFGMACMNLCVGLGLGQIMAQGGVLTTALKGACGIYMLFLAYKILRMQLHPKNANKPFTFLEGLILHPLSPKTWAMSLVGFTQFYRPEHPLLPQIGVFILTFQTFQLIFHSSWCLAGTGILRWLGQGRTLQTFNLVMASSMVGITFWAILL